ncbi:MAG: DUF2306 domain-containing protein [Vicinamibacterales bacterium]
MLQQGITIGGIPIPSREPWFLAFIAVHVAAGIVATAAGALAMLSRKQPGRHPRAGTIYFWALVVVAATMAVLTVARWPANNHLAVLGVLSLGSAITGRRARRQHRPGWRRVHIPAMGLSYVFMLTAFYVDNGPHLPLWNRLPGWAFWVSPTAIGTPIIGWALRRHSN